MRIAVDAMGGDYAPTEVVKGAVQAARDYGVAIMLVGPPVLINAELAKLDNIPLMIEHLKTSEEYKQAAEYINSKAKEINLSI